MDLPSNMSDVEDLMQVIVKESYPTLGAIIAISAYSVFVFIFYRVLAKRDLMTLDLEHYSNNFGGCLLYTSPSPRDVEESRMPSSA